MNPHEEIVSHDSADRYEATRTVPTKYIKEVALQDTAWQWAVWFVYNNGQSGTRCPYWPEECFVGSEVCVECLGCEAIQIVTKTTGRVYCKNKKAEVLPLPECYFLPEGKDRLEFETKPTLPDELCPW